MILRNEDIISSEINWQPKSQNIKELAEELNLGLDSFIFVDDNPVECAEVRANCPEVLTLYLPEKSDEIPSFLNHVWAFDTLQSTREDQERTKLYHENIKRSTYQKSSSSLKDFIDGLNLEIDIKDPLPEEISRVSQLTYRTNQFNFTTIRRSEEEIKNLLQKEDFECKVCRVKDRFGDYGLVGVIIYKKLSDLFVIDSFMLSCRVLGRGVEHQMLKSIGETALMDAVKSVQINFSRTEKNLPALNFLESIMKEFPGDISFNKNGYLLPSGYLSNLIYNPEKHTSTQISAHNEREKNVSEDSEEADHLIFEQIAMDLNSALKINQHVRSNGHTTVDEPHNLSKTQERDPLQIITTIWEEVLGKTGIRPDQHFFDVGGTSLKAVEVLSQLNEQFKKNLTIVSLFEHSTIQSLAKMIDGKSDDNSELGKIFNRAVSRRNRARWKNE
jgi:FkbH-like protein